MSALDLLPDETRAKIAAQDARVRADLLIIPEAEAAGWVVTFRDGSWHNPAQFARAGVSVWQVVPFWGPHRLGWNRATFRDGKRAVELVEAGLREALGLEVAA